jgi:hypothetical protein
MGQRPVTPILRYQVSLVVEWRGVEFVDSGGRSGVVVEVKVELKASKTRPWYGCEEARTSCITLL